MAATWRNGSVVSRVISIFILAMELRADEASVAGTVISVAGL